jgi:hypothetical protein
MDEIMEITDKTLRRLLKVSHAEFNRVDAIRRGKAEGDVLYRQWLLASGDSVAPIA